MTCAEMKTKHGVILVYYIFMLIHNANQNCFLFSLKINNINITLWLDTELDQIHYLFIFSPSDIRCSFLLDIRSVQSLFIYIRASICTALSVLELVDIKEKPVKPDDVCFAEDMSCLLCNTYSQLMCAV